MVKEKASFLNALEEAFKFYADAERAVAMSAYMKNLFPFYGIPATLRTELSKAVIKDYPISNYEVLQELVLEMWQKSEREWQYSAILLLSSYKKLWNSEMSRLLKQLITNKSWWDSVDGLTGNCVSPFLLKFELLKSKILKDWESSGNMWLIRACIIHQLPYRQKTDTDYLTSVILKNNNSKEFFIQKAIGWSLRQYAKTDAEWVKDFVEVNFLMPLSKREALKNIFD